MSISAQSLSLWSNWQHPREEQLLWRVNLGELILTDIQSTGQRGVSGGGQGGEVEGSVFSDDHDWIVLDAVVMPKDYVSTR